MSEDKAKRVTVTGRLKAGAAASSHLCGGVRWTTEAQALAMSVEDAAIVMADHAIEVMSVENGAEAPPAEGMQGHV